jgi:RsiW-degrading membrane proteinase PrsW (M82 family)
MIEEIFRVEKERGFKLWQQVLLIAAGLYVIGLATLIATDNPNLFPAVVLVGSFAVPVTFVTFLWENRRFTPISWPEVGLCFVYGGTLSLLLAGILEPIFIRRLTVANLFLAAGIEEAAKILVLMGLVRFRRHISEENGIIFGAGVGMGFAALESAGYSFTAFLMTGGSLSLTVFLTLLRALLSPAGHGTWTAILAGILFLESTPFRFRLTQKVVLAFLAVTLLHGLWNSLPLLLTGWPVVIGQLVVATAGLLILAWLWQQAKRRQAGL